jgi:hypothetical protein
LMRELRILLRIGLLATASALVSSSTTRPVQLLFDELAPLKKIGGFDATAAQRERLTQCLRKLQRVNPTSRSACDLDGDWELLYSDAPDIVGLQNAGPLLRLNRIGQSIDATAGTIDNVIEYGPAAWVPGAGEDDTFQQRVLLTYEVDAESGRKCSLKIAGVAFKPGQLAGINLASAPPLTVKGLLTLPFGDFECVYNDGSLRVVRTLQGYWSVNRRMPEGNGWGEL